MSTAPMSTAEEIDRLARSGDFNAAAAMLEAELAAGDGKAAQWLQLAGLHRAARRPRRALEAVHRSLALAPFDFTALVMRASLLERLNDAGIGQAWDEALAQHPGGELHPAMAPAVAHGEKVRDAWLAEREARLAEAAAGAERRAGEDEAWRIRRFRANVLHKTKIFHSTPTHFHYPGITEREYHPRGRFPWLAEVEAATDAIRVEMLAAMASERAELLPYVQYEDYEALEHWRPLNRNRDWTAIHLIKQGAIVEANASLCPRTMALLARLPQPEIPGASANAMFSVLAPRTTIPPHVGVNNTRLLCHLPLVVPEGCWFRVGAETRLWREGEAFVFDDTIEHEAKNPTDQLRVVMIFDVWHPDLSAIEREAVAATVAAENVTGTTL